ncbi:hypothetical protein M0812_12170 [Anaeramoeba flamelloides]|uniref:Endonuclease/exonuclease/phosphatase domain-containing protein n=1 Tax=Anaeramoeba flamelloides TaxID=1746091 RepID=A0AAV7ZR10_9EUKA|nr:hypothetical protein M0812_12170 [Anaeramoeba flamelloides]
MKYGNISTYEERNFGHINEVGRKNKLIFKTTEEFLSVLEIFSLINNPIPLRVLRRGEREIEIWDESFNILTYQETFLRKIRKIHQSIKMLKYDRKNRPKFIEKGRSPQENSEITLKIATLNVGGIGRDEKILEMEKFIFTNNIDIALIQETKRKNTPYLRKYRAISKKSYGNNGTKGGLTILFKPFLRLFINEKLIDHEDFMGINLNNITIINCYGRQKDPEGKIDFVGIFKNKIKEISENWKIEKILIGGDFNLNNEQMGKITELRKNNFQIIQNEIPSRVRNIDHLVMKNIRLKERINKCLITPLIPKEKQRIKIKKNKKNKENEKIELIRLSDHKMVINEIKIEKDLEIREIFSCRDESKFQEEFISNFENEELNKENFSKFQQKFRKKIHLIQDIKYDDYITLQKMIDFISDPSTKKIIIREKTKNWDKILKKNQYGIQTQ